MSPPTRVLHVFGTMDRGGAELRTIDVMRFLGSSDYEMHYCALSGLPGELDDEIRALGGQVHAISLRNPSFPVRFLQLARQNKYDVIHSHIHYTSGLILFLAALARVPGLVAHFRNSSDGRKLTPRRIAYRTTTRKLIDQFATHILAVSEATMLATWGTGWRADNRCGIIYNGIDLEQFSQPGDRRGVFREFRIPEGSSLFIHVGRFSRQKNQLRLLNIFGEVAKIVENAHLLLVGRGGNSIERASRDRARGLGIEDRVIFAGERTDIPCLLKAADLMIYPSLHEGLPGAVLEANAAGLPVLAGDLPVIREISQQLILIQSLSLDRDDRAWADSALSLSVEGKAPGVRQMAIDAFAASEFRLERSADKHRLIWESVRER